MAKTNVVTLSPAQKAAATKRANAERIANMTPGQRAVWTKTQNGTLSEIAQRAAATRKANAEAARLEAEKLARKEARAAKRAA